MCKVSVLMPVYNAEKYLAEAINSIIAQTFTDWELIIINDGSTDESEKIARSYTDKRICYVANEENMGLIKTLNKGLKLCKGTYIARMDADDIALPKRLSQQVSFFEKHPNHILVGTNALVINQNGETTGKVLNPTSNSLLQISLLFTNPLIHPSVMVRKWALEDCTFNEDWLHVEDYELWTRLANKGKIANLNACLLKYRWHDSNVSVKHTKVQEYNKNALIRGQLLKLNIEASNEDIAIHRLTFQLYSLGKKNALDTNKFDEVCNWFLKLAKQNKKLKVYSQSDFEAFLWSRWLVLCTALNKKTKIFFPKFASYTPIVIWKTIKLAIYLSRK